MSTFTPAELDYLRTQRLGRLATVGPDGTPHATPVGFFYDPDDDTIVIGSSGNMATSKKYRDARRTGKATLVVDDLASTDPWTPRGVEIRGSAQALDAGGPDQGRRLGIPFEMNEAYLRITPVRIVSWGIDSNPYAAKARGATR
jgi:pyridoxamine 5'-phosphate oxidase family protein